MINCRAVALDILMRYEKEGSKLRPILIDVVGGNKELDRRDRAFIKALTEGTVERLITLDYIIDKVAKTKTGRMKPVIRMILRMGAYQLVFMDHVPDSAAVNEAVKLVRSRHMEGLGPFVNGVLRAVIKLRDEGIDYPDPMTEYSVPAWIADIFSREYGEDAAFKMMCAGTGERPVYLRLNKCLTSADELTGILSREGVAVERVKKDPVSGIEPVHTLKITSGQFIPAESESFAKGLYSVQDLSSQLAVYELWERIEVYINENNIVDINVIDLCSAPGGKTCFLSEMLGSRSHIISCDISGKKLDKIRENVERTGVGNIELLIRDASLYDPDLKGKFDVVIADLPCSGLGVLGRKVDIKFRVRQEDVRALCKLQKQILDNAASYLKPGGILLYSVCTVTKEETSDQAFYLEKKGLHRLTDRVLLQGVDPCDGFYYSLWKA